MTGEQSRTNSAASHARVGGSANAGSPLSGLNRLLPRVVLPVWGRPTSAMLMTSVRRFAGSSGRSLVWSRKSCARGATRVSAAASCCGGVPAMACIASLAHVALCSHAAHKRRHQRVLLGERTAIPRSAASQDSRLSARSTLEPVSLPKSPASPAHAETESPSSRASCGVLATDGGRGGGACKSEGFVSGADSLEVAPAGLALAPETASARQHRASLQR